MRENADQNNSEYGHFLRSVKIRAGNYIYKMPGYRSFFIFSTEIFNLK